MIMTNLYSSVSLSVLNGRFSKLGPEFFDDLQDFAYRILPKIVVTAVVAWLLTRALKAIAEGRFNKEIIPLEGLEQDETPRQSTLEKMKTLEPLEPGGKLTAAVSSQTCDGSSAVLVVSEKALKRYNLKPRARVVATANQGDCPTLMLNAPVPAARKVLAKAGLTEADIDLWEINEAFAVVAEKFIRDLKLDREKVNVNGGAMALGHPIGATGSILIGTVLDELERRDLRRGLITMCAAGGMAPAIIVERMD